MNQKDGFNFGIGFFAAGIFFIIFVIPLLAAIIFLVITLLSVFF